MMLSEKKDDKLYKCPLCKNEYCTPEETYFKEKDVKQFIKELENFIDDKTMIQSSGEGTNVEIIRFFPFEWEEFKNKYLGFEE